MTLDKTQLTELRTLIEGLLPSKPELDLFLQDQAEVPNIDLVALGDNLRIIIAAICTKANKEGWIEYIVGGLVHQFPLKEEVKTFAAKVAPLERQAGRAVVEAYDACFLNGRPFIDRTNLRALLRELKGETPLKKPRILVVRGKEKTGKSHSLNLIKYVAKSFGYESVYVDLLTLPVRNRRDLTPDAIGASIARQMKLKDMPQPGNEQLSRWPAAFFSWLAGELRDDEREWWIVIDGFTSVKVSQDVHDFIDDLAGSIEKLDPLDGCRVVLISYDDTLLANYDLIMERDDTEFIEESHLSLFFAQFYRDFGPMDDDDTKKDRISDELKIVLENIKGELPQNRLKRMEEEVVRSCRRLAKK
jgi:hypothetical protein